MLLVAGADSQRDVVVVQTCNLEAGPQLGERSEGPWRFFLDLGTNSAIEKWEWVWVICVAMDKHYADRGGRPGASKWSCGMSGEVGSRKLENPRIAK